MLDLNEWVGDRLRVGLTGEFGVPGKNDNGRRAIDFCAKRGLCLVNTYIDHKSLHKYTRVARGQGREEVMIMIDLILGKKDMQQDVKGMGQRISEHHILCKVTLVGI